MYVQWLFLVPLIGGRYHIIPQLAVYTTILVGQHMASSGRLESSMGKKHTHKKTPAC